MFIFTIEILIYPSYDHNGAAIGNSKYHIFFPWKINCNVTHKGSSVVNMETTQYCNNGKPYNHGNRVWFVHTSLVCTAGSA